MRVSSSSRHDANIAGHALVGWKEREKISDEWDFLETTINSSFEKARVAGNDTYRSVKHLCGGQRSVAILNTKQFAILIDVHQTISDQKVAPI